MQADDPGRIHALIEALDATSKEFATRRMNRAIARAIAGRQVDDVSSAMGAPIAGK
jgi:molecular chaperone HscA